MSRPPSTIPRQVVNGVFRNFNGEAYRAATWANDVGPAGFMSTNADHFLMAQKAQNEGYAE